MFPTWSGQHCEPTHIVFNENSTFSEGPSVTVTTQHSSAVVAPPYPIADRHPVPQTCGPAVPGFATHTAPYPTHPPHPQPGKVIS